MDQVTSAYLSWGDQQYRAFGNDPVLTKCHDPSLLARNIFFRCSQDRHKWQSCRSLWYARFGVQKLLVILSAQRDDDGKEFDDMNGECISCTHHCQQTLNLPAKLLFPLTREHAFIITHSIIMVLRSFFFSFFLSQSMTEVMILVTVECRQAGMRNYELEWSIDTWRLDACFLGVSRSVDREGRSCFACQKEK